MVNPPFTSVPVHFDDIDAAGADHRPDLATVADLISS
jgi:hypothetical protein